MLKDAFYESLRNELIIGLFFVLFMRYFGKRNCVEMPLEKHIALKTCALFLFVIGVIYGVWAYRFSYSIEYPSEALSHRTPGQTIVFNSINSAILFIGLGAYLWFFRKSGTTPLQKTLKVLGYSALFILFPKAFDINNFSFVVFALNMIILVLCYLMDWKDTVHKDVKLDEGSMEMEKKEELVDNEREVCSSNVEL